MNLTKQIFISNRLPFSVDKKTNELKRNSGGLVSALLGVNLDQPFYWMGLETNALEAAKLSKEAHEVQSNLILKPVVVEEILYSNYYDKFCNDTLWPLFHYEGQHTFFHRDYWDSYRKVNEIMANAILEIAEDNDSVWIHDFHFFMLPKLLKDKKPNLKIGIFLHTPFPCSEIYRQLPVREELLNHVIQADLIGFHEHSYLRRFSDTMKSILSIDSTFFKASIGNHTLHLGVYPISIDSMGLKQKAASEEVRKKTNEFYESIVSDFLILGVDRLDYSKGLKLKLKGFKRALEKYPELRGKINLLQVAIPTRVNVPSYINLKNEIDKLIGEINGQFGTPGHIPVHYIFNSVNEIELLALYRRAQSILITSKRDGMNLVAMEYSICQDQNNPGVLILSEFTGAASLLSDGIIINPWDVDSTANAIFQAYMMSREEKAERVTNLQDILTQYSASQWAEAFLNDLNFTCNVQTKHETQHLKAFPHSWPNPFCEQLQAKKNLKLFLDYDGTLVGFSKKPEKAPLNDKIKEVLRKITEKTELTIISGRSKEFLEAHFEGLNVHLVAEHGAYYKKQNGQWVSRVSTDIKLWYEEVQRVMESYTKKVPFSSVELKNSSLVWHYRQSPQEFALFQAKRLDDELQACLSNLPVSITMGAMIVEAKAIECNKGEYLKWEMASDTSDALYFCMGDDKTDEDMFQALKHCGISVKVGQEATSALFSLGHQQDVVPFLENLTDYL